MSNGERWLTRVEAAIDRYHVEVGARPFAVVCTPVVDSAMREAVTGRKEIDPRPFSINGVRVQADPNCDPEQAYFVTEAQWRAAYE